MKIQTMPQLATLNASSNGCCHNEFLSNALAIQIEDINGSCIDGILCATSSSATACHHHDGLGSIVERYLYDAFGAAQIFDSSFSPLPSTLQNNRFLFTGREWLAEAGLYDYRNRTYSTTLGRFLQTDPIRFAAGDVNIYRYVANNPINLVNPDGLMPLSKLASKGIVKVLRTKTAHQLIAKGRNLIAGSKKEAVRAVEKSVPNKKAVFHTRDSTSQKFGPHA